MEKLFINKKTSEIVDNSTIIAQDEDGIVVNSSNCWKFITSDDLETKNIYSEYYDAESLQDKDIKSFETRYKIDAKEPIGDYNEKAEYIFGLKNLRLYTKQFDEVSGIISNELDTTNCSYVTISCQQYNQDNGSIELSILDGDIETPILANDTKIVNKEKLFYNNRTRFIIDNVNGITPILYEDNVESSKNYLDLTSTDYENHDYALTYTAAGEVNKYIPQSTRIDLKVILRQYNLEAEPVELEKIIINKFGGTLEWM